MNTHMDAKFWDKAARKYAASTIKDMAGYERTLDETRRHLSSSDTVLEIGCGTGTTALRLAPSVARYVASDLSPEMIAIAREKARAENNSNIEFAVTSSDAAPGNDNSYDAVLAFSMLHLTGDTAATLRHAHRLLKPNGLFISKTPCLSEMNRLLRVAVPLMKNFGKAPNVSFFDASELETQIAATGFAIEERARHGSKRKDPRIFLVARKLS